MQPQVRFDCEHITETTFYPNDGGELLRQNTTEHANARAYSLIEQLATSNSHMPNDRHH